MYFLKASVCSSLLCAAVVSVQGMIDFERIASDLQRIICTSQKCSAYGLIQRTWTSFISLQFFALRSGCFCTRYD